jgi:tetratricopeptide (TPR) repeat protein
MKSEVRNPKDAGMHIPYSWSSMIQFIRTNLVLPILLITFIGCKQSPPAPSPERYTAAKALFDQAAKEFHNPSAEKIGAERDRLLGQAAAAYEQLLKDYPEQTNWCAQALRSLGSVRAAQGRTNDAVKLFAQVAERYPAQDWEIIQAWKAAGDLLSGGSPAILPANC